MNELVAIARAIEPVYAPLYPTDMSSFERRLNYLMQAWPLWRAGHTAQEILDARDAMVPAVEYVADDSQQG